MRGEIYTVSIGSGGIPKYSVDNAVLLTKSGFEGDSSKHTKFHGGKDHPDQAVCLFSLENIQLLYREGYELFEGAMGENLTTRLLEYHNIRPGDTFRVGDEVVIRITKARMPCMTVEKAYPNQNAETESLIKRLWEKEFKKPHLHPESLTYENEKWGLSGFYAEVIREGYVQKGDDIEMIVDEHA